MKFKCGYCNEVFDEEALYSQTERYYAKTDTVVQKVGFSRKGKVKVKHLYVCPFCKHLLNNTTLGVADGPEQQSEKVDQE